jgi:hypothetical protein
MPRLIQVKLLTLFLDIGFNTGVNYYYWLGSSRLFPTGWIIVITLAEWPSVIRAHKSVGKTTTFCVVVF